MNHLIIHANRPKSVINRNIYGHFSEHLGRCIYGGLFVGENSEIPNVNGMRTDVVNALRKIKVPVLRWPGGCFADEYHWKDGIGPKAKRKRMVNTHWGGVVEDNSFGTHEFLELCRQIGCEPYINGNVGSGTVHEMSEWVEYLNNDGVSPMSDLRRANGQDKPWGVKYFGVGNESWGCGGNMRPSYYADEYRRYQTYLRTYGAHKIYRIACGPNVDDYSWTDTLMQIAGNHLDALTLHYYTTLGEWLEKDSATDFDETRYFRLLNAALRMKELIQGHLDIMNRYDPARRVGLIVDEWGSWHEVEPGTNPGFLYQQNTMRDALVASLNLDIFNGHADRIVMANIAQTVNVLQAVILTDGGRMVLTPTYHVFDLYSAHQDAHLLETSLETELVGVEDAKVPEISASASLKDGAMHLTLSNLSPDREASLEVALCGMTPSAVEGRVLTGDMHAYNDFDAPDVVKPVRFTGFEKIPGGLKLTLPPTSVTALTVK